MTGVRAARGPAAALLAAPLLFASAPAGAHTFSSHPHFHARVELDGMTALTVTEGQSAAVSVGIPCQSGCTPGSWYGPTDARNQMAFVDVTVTTPAGAGGAAFAGADENKRLRYSIPSTFSALNFNAPDPANGTVMLEIPDNENADGDRTVTVSTTHTFDTGGFWSTSFTQPAIATATLTILDDEPVPLTVVESGGGTAVSEDGTTDSFEVSLGGDPRAAVEVAVSSQDADECEVSLDRGATYLAAGASGTLTFVPDGEDDSAALTSEWDEAQTVTVRGVDDRADDGAQECAVRLDPGSPGAMGDARYEAQESVEVMVTNADNDVAAALSLSPSSIGEGETATVSARLPAPAASAVTLTVSAAPGTGASAGDFAQTGTTLTIAAGARTSTGSVTIAAADDGVDGPESKRVTVSATLSGGRNTVRPADATLTITDDDAAPRVVLAVAPAMIDESGPENAARVTATLSHPSSMATTVAVSAAAGVTVGMDDTIAIPAGETESADAVTLTAVDDAEQTPDREVAVSGRAENAHGVEQPAAVTLTIRDDDGAEAVTKVLLPEAARAMADSRAGAVRRRLESADAAGAPEMASLPGLLAKHGPSLQKDELDWKTALAGSSFALPLNAAGGGGAEGGVTVWGSGEYRDLDGEARGVSWDGDVVSAHLGLDRKLANGLRVGLAASWSEAKFDYEHNNREGEWELEMTSAQPYLGWTAPGGLELWASAGAGSGDLEIASGGTREESDADMWLAAAGARKPLHETESGLQVSLRGEALYSSFEVDGNGGRIQAYTADVSRLRLALEARRERTLASGARLSPRFELGLRHDGGDGETGAGVELGGGAEYAAGRLTASGGARALVANSDYDEWGADLALAYAPGAGGRGFSFRLSPSWGAVQSGAQKLWEQGASGLSGAADEADLGGRLEAELGYGLKSPWSRGLLRLTLGGEAGEDADAACRLKGAVALDASATLGLELEVRDPPSGGAERSLMATAELRF